MVAAVAEGDGVRLTVRGEEGTRDVTTEFVVLGTGYDVDVDRIEFIDGDLARRVRRHDRAPALNRHFESSVPGLYFVGPSTAASFGPLFRFVAGSQYTVPLVASQLAGRRLRRSNVAQPSAYTTEGIPVLPVGLGDR